ncbi:hypothetical protein [Prosthecomicrobium hirschii]|uniref:Lipoprotein n=1 Tax=Prosthecodimorpha hirschii TaxID=665126 RepID=A0A0P6VR20_9HYPH|nr:hypothetical protein [Prosthecomicrobium hirschii]KPL54261.1 hypothetical protein ABB55_20265 [Prosthecomicrobium hirschii]MCW1840926.1 hypothetical protein [Prosthecomicrobium hirschii]TPQ52756.1 hypothetical protein C2U72_01595 [Prosthecomicrobium hirschii]
MSTPIRFAPIAAGLATALLLAGCGGTMDSIGTTLLSGTKTDGAELDGEAIKARPVCPLVEIRSGTETLPLYETGKQGNADFLRFQISVQRVARECDINGETMSVRVGAAGRVAAGPKGATGKVQVPVRIAAVKGDQVLYSRLNTVSVDVGAPDYSALWSAVDEAMTLPANITSGVTIYVGLDDKPEKPAPKGKKPKAG